MCIKFFSKMKLLIKTNGSYSRHEISFLGVTKVAFVPCWTLSHKLGLWGNCSLWPLMACKTGVRVFKSNFFAIVVTIWWIRQYTLLMVYIYGVIKSPCRLVYLLLNFWRPFICFQGVLFSESSVLMYGSYSRAVCNQKWVMMALIWSLHLTFDTPIKQCAIWNDKKAEQAVLLPPLLCLKVS